MTIGARFDVKRNSLNAIRFALAALVIVSHSMPLGGYGPEINIGGTTFGGFAVTGFFAISGYLITGSRVNSGTIGRYLWRRFIRIYPAFLVSLFVVAVLLAPLSVALGGSGPWSPSQAVGFIVKNLGFYYEQVGIAHTLADTPYPTYWLGSLWTLTYEFLCYLAIGALVGVIPRRRLGPVLIGIFVCMTVVLCIYKFGGLWELTDGIRAMKLGLSFTAGALLFVYRDRIPLNGILAALAAAALGATFFFRVFDPLGMLPLAYLVIYVGAVVPIYLGSTHDLSYGVYIYGWPVQQLLAVSLGRSGVDPVTFTVLSLALSIPLAAFSWFVVERPAMRLKNWRPKPLFRDGATGGLRGADPFVAVMTTIALVLLALGTIQDAMNFVVSVALVGLVVTAGVYVVRARAARRPALPEDRESATA